LNGGIEQPLAAEANKIIYSMVGVGKFPDKKPVLKDIYLAYFYDDKIGGRAAQPVNFIARLVRQHGVIDGQRLQLAAVVPAQFIREAIDSLPEPRE
jgi:hypothetical protein